MEKPRKLFSYLLIIFVNYNLQLSTLNFGNIYTNQKKLWEYLQRVP